MNKIGKTNRECRLTLPNGMGQPSARRTLNMLITEESCKTKKQQDFKRENTPTHSFCIFSYFSSSIVTTILEQNGLKLPSPNGNIQTVLAIPLKKTVLFSDRVCSMQNLEVMLYF